MTQKIIYTNLVSEAIDTLVGSLATSDVHLIVDTNTAQFVLPLLVSESKAAGAAKIITVAPGDHNKTLEAVTSIWNHLTESGATRHSVIINVGGGVITDMGGFAAATFKRGIRFINVPTTLLGAVDAAVGGKTGINFNGYKNEIGAFAEASAVIISTQFFNTLPAEQLRSGYAEMIKHGLIDDSATLTQLLAYDIDNATGNDDRLLRLLQQSVGVKERIVAADPDEKGLRKVLNLGHTAGHAFESLAMAYGSPIPHGYAVAYGLVVEMILSHLKLGFPSDTLHKVAAYIYDNYRAFAVSCDEYPRLIDIMRHDKKNTDPSSINFTLLADVGSPRIDCSATPDDITAALDIYRDLMHLG